MTVSFYIHRSDLQELDYLVDNWMIIPFDEKTREKAVVIDCFNTSSLIDQMLKSDKDMTKMYHTLFIQVNVEYKKFDKIKEYLQF